MRGVVANFAAGLAVILSVLPHAAIVLTLANSAELLTIAIALVALAGNTDVSISHGRNVTRISALGKCALGR